MTTHSQSGATPIVCLLPEGATALKEALCDSFGLIELSAADCSGTDLRGRAEAMIAAATAKGCASFALIADGLDSATALYAARLAPEAITRLVLLSPLALGADGAPEDQALAGKLADVTQQTLVLFGTRNADAPPSMGGHYKRALTACHLIHVFDAADLTIERPEAVSEVVIDFLRRGDAFLVNNKDGRVHP